MLDSTSVNSSGEFGTSGHLIESDRDFICRCCHITQVGPRYEYRNGDWLCPACFRAVDALTVLGEHRSHLAYDYMNQAVIRTRWDV